MKNTFNEWNILKQKIDGNNNLNFHVKQRQIWNCYMWINVWFEEDGKWEEFNRPILVLKKVWIMYLCLALTIHGKNNDFYYKLPEDISRKNSYLILSQPKLFDIKRFHYKIWTVPKDKFLEIQKKLKTLWF